MIETKLWKFSFYITDLQIYIFYIILILNSVLKLTEVLQYRLQFYLDYIYHPDAVSKDFLKRIFTRCKRYSNFMRKILKSY